MNAMINRFPRRLSINLIRERGLDPARNQRGCSPPLETPFNCARLKRRGLIRINSKSASLVFAMFVAASVQIANAQAQTKIPRIGYVSGTGDATNQGPYVEALRQGLRDFGYVEGKNIAIEYRGAEGKLDRIQSLVTELVQLKVDILVVPIMSAAYAAKQATKTIPIVVIIGDPVGAGIVDSLARPGGNITGLATLAPELSGKRLELLKEMVPRLSRVGILRDVDEQNKISDEYKAAARALKIQLQSLEVRGMTRHRGRISNCGQRAGSGDHHGNEWPAIPSAKENCRTSHQEPASFVVPGQHLGRGWRAHVLLSQRF